MARATATALYGRTARNPTLRNSHDLDTHGRAMASNARQPPKPAAAAKKAPPPASGAGTSGATPAAASSAAANGAAFSPASPPKPSVTMEGSLVVAQSPAPRASKEDEEGVLVSEYNKWLIIEERLESAQETRKSKLEGLEIIRDREERYRARALAKQQASIEQKKVVKINVEEKRVQNAKTGKVCRCRTKRLCAANSPSALTPARARLAGCSRNRGGVEGQTAHKRAESTRACPKSQQEAAQGGRNRTPGPRRLFLHQEGLGLAGQGRGRGACEGGREVEGGEACFESHPGG